MEIILLIIGFLLVVFGVLGSFLPALPGPPLSWLGVLCLYFVNGIEWNWWLLGITLFLTLLAVVLDYVIPAQGTKRFGGSKYGIWGTNIGLLVGLFIPPFGFIIGPFVGAFVGEMIYNSQDSSRALKAATGSFIGFLASTFFKFIVCIILLGIFFYIVSTNHQIWF